MTYAAVMASELTTVFTDRRAVLWHSALLALGPVLIILFWPSENLYAYLADGKGPGTLTQMGVTLGTGLALLSGAFTLDHVPSRPGHAFVHWYRYTPVRASSFLAGRLMFHLVHSLLLTILALPFLAVAAIPSGASAAEVLVLAAYIWLFSLSMRISGESARSTVKFNPPVVFLAFFLLFVTFLIFTYSTVRNWSPLTAMLILADPARTGPGVVIRSSALLIFFAAVGSSVAWFRLLGAEKVERAGRNA